MAEEKGDIEFDWQDVNAINSFPDDFTDDVDNIIIAILEKYGPLIVELAKTYTPVRTGALQASITFEVDAGELMLIIYGNIYYFKFVEFGTVKMSGRFMCEMAYNQMEPDMLQEIDDTTKEAAHAY